ncbi:Lrp/AsnC family transcriptional regulator [Streptomyces sp. NPDC055749]
MPRAKSATEDGDRALIHALQIAPRADWARLAGILESHPVTLAKRWDRLTSEGLAWCTGLALHTGDTPPTLAWVEVVCTGERSAARAAALVDDPHVLSVYEVTGGRDMILFTAFPDLTTLDEHLSTRLLRLPGVVRTRTHLVTALHHSGPRWRLDQLSAAQAQQLRALSGTPGDRAGPPPTLAPDERSLALTLAGNARTGIAELARRHGMSESTTRRRVRRLEASGVLTFSCMPAPQHSGWPVTVVIWAHAPSLEPGSLFVSLREVVEVMSVTGPNNLVLGVMLRSLADLPPFMAALARRVPGVRFADTLVALRCHKFAAQVLDAKGRRVGYVPPDIWAAPVAVPPRG